MYIYICEFVLLFDVTDRGNQLPNIFGVRIDDTTDSADLFGDRFLNVVGSVVGSLF